MAHQLLERVPFAYTSIGGRSLIHGHLSAVLVRFAVKERPERCAAGRDRSRHDLHGADRRSDMGFIDHLATLVT